MVREPEPVFVAVTDCEALLPTEAVTETESGETASCADADGGAGLAAVLTPPTHPAN